MQRIYLDELGDDASDSLGVNIVKLVIENQQTAPQRAKQLIEQAQVQIADPSIKRDLIDLIETIIVYKLPQKSREEIEAMLGLSELKQTKVYQEAKQEGLEEGEKRGEQRGEQRGELKAKLTTILRMSQLGFNLEMIAESLDLPLEFVQQAAELFEQQNIVAFVELLNHQRQIFSPQDLADLTELIQPLPDKREDLSDAIAHWCQQEQNTAQLEAWRQILSSLLSATIEKLVKNPDTLQTPSAPVNKAMVQNAIEQ